ncbi:MAG: hypothetical protein Q8930_03920 [Bacillota bacterium]|nr:hypothetical protein [Bacillota bacterium]
MVERGNHSKVESSFTDMEYLEEAVSHNGNGRMYYEYLRIEKNKQKNMVSGCDEINMPLDNSDYNSMFMTF